MPVFQAAYGWLASAILLEVAATSMLVKTEQFSRLWPSLAAAALYACSFYFLSHSLQGVPVGVAYALWSGVGTALIALIGFAVFRQSLDAAAILGVGLIVSGVVVMNLFSGAAAH